MMHRQRSITHMRRESMRSRRTSGDGAVSGPGQQAKHVLIGIVENGGHSPCGEAAGSTANAHLPEPMQEASGDGQVVQSQGCAGQLPSYQSKAAETGLCSNVAGVVTTGRRGGLAKKGADVDAHPAAARVGFKDGDSLTSSSKLGGAPAVLLVGGVLDSCQASQGPCGDDAGGGGASWLDDQPSDHDSDVDVPVELWLREFDSARASPWTRQQP